MLRISTNDIWSVFRAGRVPAKYARHCVALRGQRLRLLTDYAALASARPVFAKIATSQLFLVLIFFLFIKNKLTNKKSCESITKVNSRSCMH